MHLLQVVSYIRPLDDRAIPQDLMWDPIAHIWLVKEVYEAFYALNKSMQECGIPAVQITEAYRSYAMQKKLYSKALFCELRGLGLEHSGLCNLCDRSAKPGCSEHQLGTSIDVVPEQFLGRRNYQNLDFEATSQGKWLSQYAEDYGFILRYSKEKESMTHVTYKPYHYRYIGRGHAKKIQKLGLSLEEYTTYMESKRSI